MIPTSTSTAYITAKLCRRIFATHGLPCSIVTDNGTPFIGKQFHEFTKKNGIKLINTLPLHPASNSLAENAVKTFKRCMRKGQGEFDLINPDLTLIKCVFKIVVCFAVIKIIWERSSIKRIWKVFALFHHFQKAWNNLIQWESVWHNQLNWLNWFS